MDSFRILKQSQRVSRAISRGEHPPRIRDRFLRVRIGKVAARAHRVCHAIEFLMLDRHRRADHQNQETQRRFFRRGERREPTALADAHRSQLTFLYVRPPGQIANDGDHITAQIFKRALLKIPRGSAGAAFVVKQNRHAARREKLSPETVERSLPTLHAGAVHNHDRRPRRRADRFDQRRGQCHRAVRHPQCFPREIRMRQLEDAF